MLRPAISPMVGKYVLEELARAVDSSLISYGDQVSARRIGEGWLGQLYLAWMLVSYECQLSN